MMYFVAKLENQFCKKMKLNRLINPLYFLFILGVSSVLNAQSAAVLEKIKAVENGLSTYHIIQGDPTWTIAERMEHYGVPGMSIAVIHNYKVAWTKTYGFVDKEKSAKVDENTLFQAASISKPISVYAALSLIEAGKINLTKNVNNYLTAWQLPYNEFTKEEKVTLQHIVSHKAGLTIHGFLGYSPDLEVPNLVQVLDGKDPANSAAVRVDKVPGGNMRYSGGGYCVMQQMMIDVTGKTYPEILKEKVLQPIGMTKSTFAQPLPPEKLKLAATGYVPNGNMVEGRRHTYPEMAAAGLWTNAADLAKFIIDLQQTLLGNSEKVLSQAMAKKMVTSVEGDFMGLGIFLEGGRFGHGGWNEGFSSDMSGHLTNGKGVVVMINANHPPLINEVKNAVARVYNWENAAPSAHQQLAFTAEELETILGKYDAGFFKNFTVYQANEKVFLKAAYSQPHELLKIAENTYIKRAHKAPLQFLADPENEQLAMVFLSGKDTESINYTHQKQKIDIAFWIGILVISSLLFWFYKKKFKRKKLRTGLDQKIPTNLR